MEKIKISFKSKKLGRIPSLNLPPELTCRKDAPCAKGCYAKKGTFNYDNVKKTYLKNYIAYNESPENFFKQLNDVLNSDVIIYKFFRYHMAGEIIDMKYLYEMVKTANKNKKTKFLCFTKKYNLVNMYLASHDGALPKNLIIVFSAWHNAWKFENPYNLPIAYIDFKNKILNPSIPDESKHCINDCTKCHICWSLERGDSVTFKQH